MRLFLWFLLTYGSAMLSHAQEPEAYTVIEISEFPDPETTPYEDCLLAVKCRGEGDSSEQILLFELFRKRVLFPAASLAKGQIVTVTPIPFKEAPHLSQLMQANDFFDPQLGVYYAKDWAPQTEFEAGLVTEPVTEAPVSTVPTNTEVIRRSLMAHGQDVTGGLIDDFYFWVHTPRVLETDFWKAPQITKKKAIGPHEAILRFHRSLEERGIQLVLAVVPRSTSIYPGIATNIPYDPAIDGPVNQPVIDLLNNLKKEGVASIDLTSIFLSERFITHEEEAYPVYRRNDSHWSGAGVKIAAEAIAAELGGKSIPVKGASVTAETITSGYSMPVFHSKSPRDPKPETELIFRVDDAENPDLFDPHQRDARIHLLGDSFVNYGGQGAGAYGLQPHLVKLLGEPVNVFAAGSGGPMISRGQFVREANLESAKTVIWVFAESFLAPADIWLDVPVGDEAITHLEFAIPAANPEKSIGQFSSMEGLGSGIELTTSGSTVWDQIKVGPAPSYPKFSSFAELKTDSAAPAKPATATFTVLANGVEVASKTVTAEGHSARSPHWTVGLKKLAEQAIELELRADLISETPEAWKLRWTLPQLTNAGFEGTFVPSIPESAVPIQPAVTKPEDEASETEVPRLLYLGIAVVFLISLGMGLLWGILKKKRNHS